MQKYDFTHGIRIPRHMILGYKSAESEEKIVDVPAHIFCAVFLSFATDKRCRCRFTFKEIKDTAGLTGSDRANLKSGQMARIANVLQEFIENGILCIDKDSIYNYTFRETIDAQWFPDIDINHYVYMDCNEYNTILEKDVGSNVMYDLYIYLYIKSRIWYRTSPSDSGAECAKISQHELAAVIGCAQSTVSRSIARLIKEYNVIAGEAMPVLTTITSDGELSTYKPKNVYVLKKPGWQQELEKGVEEYNLYLQDNVVIIE